MPRGFEGVHEEWLDLVHRAIVGGQRGSLRVKDQRVRRLPATGLGRRPSQRWGYQRPHTENAHCVQ